MSYMTAGRGVSIPNEALSMQSPRWQFSVDGQLDGHLQNSMTILSRGIGDAGDTERKGV